MLLLSAFDGRQVIFDASGKLKRYEPDPDRRAEIYERIRREIEDARSIGEQAGGIQGTG